MIRCFDPAALGAHRLGPGDVVVVDEWTAEIAPHVVAARRAGARTTILAELIMERSDLPVVGVTGTAGKTTTTRLAAAILGVAGMEVAIAQGHAGNAWPDATLTTPTGTWLAAELTSTHLCHMHRWTGPRVAVVTCLWPDHVELHGSIENYVRAKQRLLTGEGIAVLNADDTDGRWLLGPPPKTREIVEFSLRRPVAWGVWSDGRRLRAQWEGHSYDLGTTDALPAWAHPAAALAASAAALACGAPPDAIETGLRSAPTLPHRMDERGVVNGFRVVDDSLAATPHKAQADLARFADRSLVLLVGGNDRPGGLLVHSHPEEAVLLAKAAREAARAARVMVTFGPAGDRFASLLTGGAVAVPAAAFDDALAEALRQVRPGETLLLCPAFPMNQSDRETFAAIVPGTGVTV